MLLFLEPAALPAASVYRIELVLEEILTNIIRHGGRSATNTGIEVDVAVRPERVVLTFEDRGPAFNPLQVAEPDRPADIEDAKIGGWGVSLVRKFSDALSYDRVEDRNCLRVEVRTA